MCASEGFFDYLWNKAINILSLLHTDSLPMKNKHLRILLQVGCGQAYPVMS